jgi:hypothetical protein
MVDVICFLLGLSFLAGFISFALIFEELVAIG